MPTTFCSCRQSAESTRKAVSKHASANSYVTAIKGTKRVCSKKYHLTNPDQSDASNPITVLYVRGEEPLAKLKANYQLP